MPRTSMSASQILERGFRSELIPTPTSAFQRSSTVSAVQLAQPTKIGPPVITNPESAPGHDQLLGASSSIQRRLLPQLRSPRPAIHSELTQFSYHESPPAPAPLARPAPLRAQLPRERNREAGAARALSPHEENQESPFTDFGALVRPEPLGTQPLR
jgi:hypothetical protein